MKDLPKRTIRVQMLVPTIKASKVQLSKGVWGYIVAFAS